MSLGGNASDLRLPNRRTARPGGGTGVVSPQIERELHSIREELAAMQSDVQKEVAAQGSPSELEDEVTSLYHELQRATARLEEEKAQRKRTEAELEQLRGGRLRETADVVQDLERKRNELAMLKEERGVMKEWLDRGIAECKRVAQEVAKLKSELDMAERSCAALGNDKQRLTVTIQQLSEELSTVQLALEKVHHEKSMIELRAEEFSQNVVRTEEQRKAAMSDADRLSSEVARLSQRVRGLEDAELSMQSMCACIDQLNNEIASLERNVASGTLDDQPMIRAPIAEAANDIATPKPLTVMVVDAKRLLQHLQDSLARLRSYVKRFVADKQKSASEMARKHQQEMHSLQQERQMILQRYEAESEQLRARIRDLEQEIVTVAEGVQRDMTAEANERLVALDRLTSANRELTMGNQKLKEENDKLRAKAKKMKIDWTKADESRRRFQQLQAEVQLMKQYSEKLALENKNLKIMLEMGGGTSGMSGASPMTAPQQGPSRLFEAPSSAGMPIPPQHFHGDPFDPVNLAQLHRQAFEEWKHSTLRTTQVYPS